MRQCRDENEARQLEALGVVDRLFSEKLSGKSAHDRTQLQEMLAYVREGYKVRVKSPDRLTRSTTDLLVLVEKLEPNGVGLEFVDNPALNTDTPQGEFMLTVLAAIAQLERKTIRDRQAEGIAIAKRRGAYDRAPNLTVEQIEKARQRVAADVPTARVARDLGVSRQTLYAPLNGSGKDAGVQLNPDRQYRICAEGRGGREPEPFETDASSTAARYTANAAIRRK